MSAKQRRQGKRLCVKRETDKVLPILESQVPIDVQQLQISLKKLLTYKIDLEALDNTVFEEITDDAKVELEIAETAGYNDELLDFISRAEIMVESAFSPHQVANLEQAMPNANRNVSGKTLRLPKLELASFSGEPLDWQSFWDSFDNSVNSNPSLSAIDKFTYLKGLLRGDALKAVEGYRLTAANYGAVVDTLIERFGNKQLAIFAHFEAMLALPQASYGVDQLQSVSDACEQHIRSLVALGLDESTFAQVFTPIMLSKLPKFVKIELHRRNGSQMWTLEHLREWLKDEIRARDMGERSFTDDRQPSKDASTGSKQKIPGTTQDSAWRKQNSTQKSVSTGLALVSDATQQRSIVCAFCGDSHYSDTCTKFPDTDSRKKNVGNRCFVCLRKGHGSKACNRKIPCLHCKKAGHHRSLCYAKFGRPGGSQGAKASGVSESSLNVDAATKQTAVSDVDSGTKRTILQTACTTISPACGGNSVPARLLFDTAGSRSFITEAKRQELKLPYKSEELISIAGFQSRKRRTAKYKIVEFSVQCSNGSCLVISASVVPSITCPIQKIPISADRYPMLTALPLAEPLSTETEFVPIDVLIGLDYYYEFVTGERIQCPDGPLLLSSKLGYITTGRVVSDIEGPETIAVMLLNTKLPEIQATHNFSVEKFWDLEDIGMKDSPKQLSGDDEALRYHSETLERDHDGRYVSRWPWKCKEPELADNFDVAFGRLTSLLRRLKTDAAAFAAYSAVIDDQLQKGIVEVVPGNPTGPSVYYIPHHCVITPSKATTKIRIVYDASSSSRKDKPSLNDCLHRGPVLLKDLCGLLMRFRLQPVALVSDVEKAFLQIGLHDEERDVTRFLWVKDVKQSPVGDNLVVYRFARIPFGVISSPFVLENTMCQHLLLCNSDVSLKILRDHYVDNVITGEVDEFAAIRHYHEAKALFQSARMNLREWFTNSEAVRNVFSEADRGSEKIPKVLGMRWDYCEDLLSSEFPQKSTLAVSVVTKRWVLKSVVDPLGLFSPITVSGKMFVQDLWKASLSWDEPLPDEFCKRWEKIVQNLEGISGVRVPRFVGNTCCGGAELHVFCDASMRACAAVVYLRTLSPQKSCAVILAKTRLAPAKAVQTIPRLELVAVVIGTRLLKFTEEQLRCPIDRRVVWTDSQCTLHWIQRDQVSTRFVENRLKEIRKHSDIEFRYVSSEQNPADLPSRGCDVKRLQDSSLWWSGPSWLLKDERVWPAFEVSSTVPSSDQSLVINEKPFHSDLVVEFTRFSTFHRLLRCVAFILRFLANVRKPKSDRFVGYLKSHELGAARHHVLQIVQSQNFPGLFTPKCGEKANIVRQLGVFRDSTGLLRCSGRFASADMGYDAKYPILMPKNCHVTDLVIACCHQQLLHAGVAETLAQVRQQFWVVHGRSSVRKVLRQCVRCRKIEGGSYKIPPPPDLPSSRVSEAPPFTNTGLDYLGPLYLKNSDGSIRKCWVVLFTCMVIRAVHLDLVSELSTEQFLLALRRFIGVYGVPRRVVSDNASQFQLAKKVLHKLWKELLESESVQHFASVQGIHWEFIVEMAPWMGGFYERLVGVVKLALKKCFQKVLATDDELRTVLIEIASVVNSRPLVYVENEIGFEALTPAHFLSKRTTPGLPRFPASADEFAPGSVRVGNLVSKWRRLQVVSDRFWSTWRHQYLQSLREQRNSQHQRNCSMSVPTVGDVVQVMDSVPRAQWRLAKIVELIPSKDDQTRSVVLRLSTGKHIRRPIKLLCPLEVGEHPPAAVDKPLEAGEHPPAAVDKPLEAGEHPPAAVDKPLETGEHPPAPPAGCNEVCTHKRILLPRNAATLARVRWQKQSSDTHQ